MTERKKPSLNVSRFIFSAVNNVEFRQKYLGTPAKLSEEFDMKAEDVEAIAALDLIKVKTQIDEYGNLDAIVGKTDLAAAHTKNSHTSHSKDAHSNSSHSNGAESFADTRLDTLVNRLQVLNLNPGNLLTDLDKSIK